ncbi:hypothetical protein [Nannocystis pusilla]|uniref:hypothetical protein n=1 Tax=Nannocystis pusilla TaxID=889268 RepID=UPI003B7EB477
MSQRLVRPVLDGLSLLVFLFAVTCAVRHMLGPGCRGYACLDSARDELQTSAALLEQQAHLDLDGLQASLAHGDPLTEVRVAGRRGRLEPLDPWQRPSCSGRWTANGCWSCARAARTAASTPATTCTSA